MKKLLSIFLIGAAFAACEQPNQVPSNSVQLPLKSGGGGGSSAHPALAYIAAKTSHNSTYATIGVMDTDGSNATNIYTSPYAGGSNLYAAT